MKKTRQFLSDIEEVIVFFLVIPILMVNTIYNSVIKKLCAKQK